MFHEDRAPVGLYVENGTEEMRVVTADGPGNFGLLPNGVLCLTDGAARIVESRRYAENPPACRDATQSGPMLVIDGDLHPRFIPDGASRNIRNGVGVEEDGRIVHLVISNVPVNFHHFARFFRDHLGVPDRALFRRARLAALCAGDRGGPISGCRSGRSSARWLTPRRSGASPPSFIALAGAAQERIMGRKSQGARRVRLAAGRTSPRA